MKGSRKIIIRSRKSTTKTIYVDYADASLVSGDFRTVVKLSPHLEPYRNEWIAANTFDFFNGINSLFSTLSEFCTSSVAMNGPGDIEYVWIDSQKRNVRVSAPQYVDFMFTQIQGQLDDESLFPTKSGSEFPKDFHLIVRGIFKHYFRLFCHVYHSYFEKIIQLKMEEHWNTIFAHVYVFAKEFDLIDKKELAPLNDLIEAMKLQQ